MDAKKFTEGTEKRIKGLFGAVTSRLTKKQNLALVIIMFIVFELISYFALNWHIQLFLYHVMMTAALLLFCTTWYVHSLKHAKEDVKPVDEDLDEEPEEFEEDYSDAETDPEAEPDAEGAEYEPDETGSREASRTRKGRRRGFVD